MNQLQIFVIVLNSAFFSCFVLTGSKISPCRSEERNRETGKEKQEDYFQKKMKCVFQRVITNFDFERYINKK